MPPDAVVDEPIENGWAVRTFREAYDIDPTIFVGRKTLQPGDWGRIRLTRMDEEGLRGKWLRTL